MPHNPGDGHGSERTSVTLHLRLSDCVIDEEADVVLYALEVEKWREWLPAMIAACSGMAFVDADVRGEG